MPGTVRRGLTSVAVVGGALSMMAMNAPPAAETADDDPASVGSTLGLAAASVGGALDDDEASGSSISGPAAQALPGGSAGALPGGSAQPLADRGSAGPPSTGGVENVVVSDDGSDLSNLVEAVRREQQQAEQARAQGTDTGDGQQDDGDSGGLGEAVGDAADRITDALPGGGGDADSSGDSGESGEAGDAGSSTSGTVSCGLNTGELGDVRPWVDTAARFLGCQYGQPEMIGVASRSGPSDHPDGEAVDFLVDRNTGDSLASCALANQQALGVKYVIWRQRINYGSGWEYMEDRGSATANHYDHVHVSFRSSSGSGDPERC